jgi:sugar O-acyltransferase (sialic acid O-acetyltransferase NeuD family)
MTSVVIYATGSSILVDIEESLHRADLKLKAGIRNHLGPCHLSDPTLGVDVTKIDQSLISLPFIVPLFTPANRRQAVLEARSRGFTNALTLVDHSVSTPRTLMLGEGVYVNVGSSFGAASSLGAFTFINRGATIGHHFDGADFVSIGPGVVIAGQVSIGTGALIGAGAVILPQIRIGAHAVVGAGAVVTKSVPDRHMVVGNPARVVREGLKGFDTNEADAP